MFSPETENTETLSWEPIGCRVPGGSRAKHTHSEKALLLWHILAGFKCLQFLTTVKCIPKKLKYGLPDGYIHVLTEFSKVCQCKRLVVFKEHVHGLVILWHALYHTVILLTGWKYRENKFGKSVKTAKVTSVWALTFSKGYYCFDINFCRS